LDRPRIKSTTKPLNEVRSLFGVLADLGNLTELKQVDVAFCQRLLRPKSDPRSSTKGRSRPCAEFAFASKDGRLWLPLLDHERIR